MKILIAITTGRASFSSTADMLAKNILSFGHLEKNFVGVAINYDETFMGLPEESFLYKTKNADLFHEKIYLGGKDVPEQIDFMISKGVKKEIAEVLSQSTGYGNKKNLIILEAIKRDYDVVLFWDDDEYPFVCSLVGAGNHLVWSQPDIIGAHIIAYKNYSADAAFGFYTGYASPIPLNLNQRISLETAAALSDALSMASDVVSPSTFIESNQIFKGVDSAHLKVQEIPRINGGKWISGGNFSLRIESVKKNLIPPYFTPVGTRADDTILSMALDNARVFQVPAGIFHDAFFEYKSIGNNEFPDSIIYEEKMTDAHVKRFAKALRGWVGYAPIFLRIQNGAEYRILIQQMINKMEVAESLLLRDFPEIHALYEGATLSDILKKFDSEVEHQHSLIRDCYSEWKKLV